MAKTDMNVSTVRRAKHGWILTTIFAVISIAWILPIAMVLLNSFKRKAYIFANPFGISNVKLSQGFARWQAGISKTFVGFMNYKTAIKQTKFFRVHNAATKIIYLLCLFSMIVPFQMVMFTLSKFANILHLSNPLGITIVYLGFGAGLAVFMFTGFVKSVSVEIEEAAMIDGCTPIQTYFKIILPIMKPTIVTVAILESMWVWNDYLLPSLVLNINKYKTIPIAVQFLKQSHGQVDWGAMMAVLVLAIVPIVVFYIAAQKYIIEGVLAGAVKG